MQKLRYLLGLILLMQLHGPVSAGPPENAVWIDVRSTVEYQLGHLEGAVHIPHDEIVQTTKQLGIQQDQPIYLYCMSGGRAGKAKSALEAAGFSQVINVGGLEDARNLANQTPE